VTAEVDRARSDVNQEGIVLIAFETLEEGAPGVMAFDK
jgi:hypothetical protein